MTAPVLVCTVGGSPAPIIGAIRAVRPARVVLLCTEDVPALRQKGSRDQVPGVLAAAQFPADRAEVVIVPPDDPDAVFAQATGVLDRLGRQQPGPPVTADYTGGTKSMSAGLLQAALMQQGVTIQIMTGERSGTDKVVAGTERPWPLRFDLLHAERALEQASRLWSAYGYAETAQVLEPFAVKLEHADGVPQLLRQRLAQVWRASEMLAHWDRFDHGRALHYHKTYKLGRGWPAIEALRLPLEVLADQSRRMPLMLLDLWHNAGRRAARGQHDDAVARCYRLVEATAQHLLKARGIDTSAIDLALLPEAMRGKWEGELGAKREAGLVKAWRLYGDLDPDHPIASHLRQPWQGEKPLATLDQWIARRNRSLLAHGFEPVGEAGWAQVKEWMDRHWLAVIWPAVAAGADLPQLPQALP